MCELYNKYKMWKKAHLNFWKFYLTVEKGGKVTKNVVCTKSNTNDGLSNHSNHQNKQLYIAKLNS